MHNNKYENILLSVLVISHSQEVVLPRCLESILRQKLNFKYEIIISDDFSTDSTWNIIQHYVDKFPGLIYGSQTNSDECHPSNTSQRSGWNRCNAYKLARGKYLIHIDADDYFTGTDVLQAQVDMLEKHPECSLCMQNIWILKEGADLETGHSWFPLHQFKNGQTITAKEFINNDFFILNQAFVMRRNTEVDPVTLYGKRYVDSVITYHHLQFGHIVCVNRCDYVYMKHPAAITESLPEADRTVLWCLAIYIPLLIPRYTGLYFGSHLKEILHVVNIVRKRTKILKESVNSIQNMGAYIYNVMGQPYLTKMDKVRLNIIRFYLIILLKLKIKSSLTLRALYCLLINSKIDKNARFACE